MSRLTSSILIATAGWLAASLFTTLRADTPQGAASPASAPARAAQATTAVGMFAP